jgi:hypothetical protein
MSTAKVRHRRRRRARTAIPTQPLWVISCDYGAVERATLRQYHQAEFEEVQELSSNADPPPASRRPSTARAIMLLAALAGMGFGL